MTQSIPGTLYVKKEKATLRKKPIEKFTTKTTQIYQKTKSIFPHLNKIKTRSWNRNNNETES